MGLPRPEPIHHLLLRLWIVLLFSTWIDSAFATCRLVRRGLSRDIVLKGTVLTVAGALPADSVLFIQSGKIAHVGDICGLGTRGADASVVDCSYSGSVISPGFINTHEHIDYSAIARPFADIGERVRHRHDWRLGARNHTMRALSKKMNATAATAWGELRHVFSGTTSLVGGEMAPGLARNLDFADALEDGLHGHRVVRYDTFPLDDGRLGITRTSDCDYGPGAIDYDAAAGYHRLLVHVGEGVDAEAANEFRCLSDSTYDTTPLSTGTGGGGGGGLSTDILAPNLALVHALGLTDEHFDLVAARGAKVVWSPRSNVFLYGRTLNVTRLLDEVGITVALGTDWLPSGSATMAREAVCAAHVTRVAFGVEIQPKTLWEMATVNAAVVAGFEDSLGSLDVGKMADVVVFASSSSTGADTYLLPGSGNKPNDHANAESEKATADPFAEAIFAPQERIELVLRGGKVLLAGSAIRDLATGNCETVAFGDVETKVVCVADELGSSFKEFEKALGDVYPAILPPEPPDEPSCEPDKKFDNV
ncbi:metal dependent amidohydrolase [Xylariaceae sp. FL0594]|nr:metal dependent amidohydrolase [Xylariaceae sp. FL0594]